MGQIYGIKNTSSNKIIYIGQTIRDYKVRWQQHKQQSKERNYALYNAFKKYGIKNFMPQLIEEWDDSLLNEREEYWIRYYHTLTSESGYNITAGGNSISDALKKPVYQYNLNGNYIGAYDSINEAQWKVGEKAGSVIHKAVNGSTQTAYGYLWSFEKKDKIQKPIFSYRKILYQYDKKNTLIQSYDSVNQAAKALGKPATNISACALGKKKQLMAIFGHILVINRKKVF